MKRKPIFDLPESPGPEDIKAARQALGLNQHQFADWLGYKTQVAVSKIETRDSDGNPKMNTSTQVNLLLRFYLHGLTPADFNNPGKWKIKFKEHPSPDDIEAARESLGLTKKEMAQRLGYSSWKSYAHVERWKDGQPHRTMTTAAVNLLKIYLSGIEPRKTWPELREG